MHVVNQDERAFVRLKLHPCVQGLITLLVIMVVQTIDEMNWGEVENK